MANKFHAKEAENEPSASFMFLSDHINQQEIEIFHAKKDSKIKFSILIIKLQPLPYS